MKKFISVFLTLCMISGFAAISATAAEEKVIYITKNMFSGIGRIDGLSPSGWGENGTDVAGFCIAPENGSTLPENAAITVNTDIPEGVYDVYYWITGNHENQNQGRAGRILDSDIEIKDMYGVHTVKSIKPHFYYEGYVKVGTYLFAGDGTDYLKATINEDNSIVRAINTAMMLTTSKIKFVPVTDDYSEFLFAINNAQDSEGVSEAVKNYADNFIDNDALVYMEEVYAEIIEKRPSGGYTSALEIKNVFEESVCKRLKKVIYDSSSFGWKIASDSSGYRMNRATVELSAQNSASAVVTFKGIESENLKKIEFKPDGKEIRTNVIIKSFSGTVYDAPSGNWDPNLETSGFAELENPVYMLNSPKEVSEQQVIEAISENGYISFYMEPEMLNYVDTNASRATYNPTAKLIATYDISDVGGEAELEGTFEDGITIEEDILVGIENKVLTLTADEDFATDEFIKNISVKKGGEDVEFTAKMTDSKTITLTFSDKLDYNSEYVISSDKYLKFNGDVKRYTLNYSFSTEKYPMEFSGLTVKDGTQILDSLDNAAGKNITVSALVKNNTLGVAKVMLMVNLFDNTEDGIKMISSKLVEGEISEKGELSLCENIAVPSDITDCFLTANIWDTIKEMNTVKIYNTESYEKFE